MIIKLLLTILLTWRTAKCLNFLLIIVDDLRPTLGIYGDKNAYTPNIDKLAENGISFSRAYAQQALCAPSRNSFLTSRRPDTLQLYDFYSYWRNTVGNFTTLPQHLKNHGYRTKSVGKIFHPGISSNYSDDSPYSWTDKPFHPSTNRYKNSPVCPSSDKSFTGANLICPVSVDSMPRKTLPDLEILEAAKVFIKNQANDERPFFLAVGFEKPHIPLKFPEEYLKYHPLSKFNIVDPYDWPKNISDVAYNPWTDIRRRDDVKKLRLKFPWEKIPVDFAKKVVQSYYAAVTYVDDLIGILLNELRSSKFHDNTVVLLTSDHGWSLGEHAEWAKYSNFEVALQVPLIISIPRIDEPRVTVDNVVQSGFSYPNSAKQEEKYEDKAALKKQTTERILRCNNHSENSGCLVDIRNVEYGIFTNQKNVIRLDSMVELVDIFPTIAEFAGFPISTCPDYNSSHNDDCTNENRNCNETISSVPNLCSEGISLVPLIKAGMENTTIPWKNGAFSQYPRPGLKPTLKPNSDKPRLSDITVMGYTLRTKKYRYTAWLEFLQQSKKPNWEKILAEELYNHDVDFGENSNIAMNPNFYDIKIELRKLLQGGWRKSLPKVSR